MITMITGKTGSGKTWWGIKKLFKEWKRGRDIYSNTILFFEKYKKKNRKYGQIQYFEDISELLDIREGVIFIDEGQVLFNARNWEALPFEFQYKLQQHRKHKLDLICTAQNMGTVDIAYRRLVQEWYHCKDRFALFGIRNPNLFSLHGIEIKDIDMLYNTVDDLQVPTLKTKNLIISKYRRRLYDTMYDIGFDKLKTLWIYHFDEESNKKKRKAYIISKQAKLQDALRQRSSLISALNPTKLRTSRMT